MPGRGRVDLGASQEAADLFDSSSRHSPRLQAGMPGEGGMQQLRSDRVPTIYRTVEIVISNRLRQYHINLLSAAGHEVKYAQNRDRIHSAWSIWNIDQARFVAARPINHYLKARSDVARKSFKVLDRS